MQPQKKESSITNIFIYLLIAILIILIAIPPLTRVFFKEESSNTNINNVNNSNNDEDDSNTVTTATALTCRRQVTLGTMVYNITITSNYGDDTLNRVTFYYELPTVVDPTITDNPIVTEMANIRNSGLVEETTNETSTTFVLNREAKEADPTNTSLDAFFQPLDAQTTTLESYGYTCSVLTA